MLHDSALYKFMIDIDIDIDTNDRNNNNLYNSAVISITRRQAYSFSLRIQKLRFPHTLPTTVPAPPVGCLHGLGSGLFNGFFPLSVLVR